jgi:CRP-like cAMP-binding protein
VVTVDNGAFFFMQGDPAEHTFLSAQGKVRLSQLSVDGQQVLQGYIGPGREFGLIAAVSAAQYPVSAQAVGRSVALAWDQQEVRRLIESDTRLAGNALRIMGRQIAEFQTRIRELSTQRVERRLARALVRLARQSGRETPEGLLIDLPLTRQDLAEMIGATLFTVSRTLKAWETRGLIHSGRGRIVLVSMHGLVGLAEDLDADETSIDRPPADE